MWSCWIKLPYHSKHHCLVAWEFIISKVASLISNALSCFITREKVVFGGTSGLIIFLMFSLLPLSIWVGGCASGCVSLNLIDNGALTASETWSYQGQFSCKWNLQARIGHLNTETPFFHICSWVQNESHPFFLTSPELETLNFRNTNQTTGPNSKAHGT